MWNHEWMLGMTEPVGMHTDMGEQSSTVDDVNASSVSLLPIQFFLFWQFQSSSLFFCLFGFFTFYIMSQLYYKCSVCKTGTSHQVSVAANTLVWQLVWMGRVEMSRLGCSSKDSVAHVACCGLKSWKNTDPITHFNQPRLVCLSARLVQNETSRTLSVERTPATVSRVLLIMFHFQSALLFSIIPPSPFSFYSRVQ